MEKAGKHQEIFDTLSDLECKLYYTTCNLEGLPFEKVTEVHDQIKKALIIWHRITRVTNK